jgi:hypothetical protein
MINEDNVKAQSDIPIAQEPIKERTESVMDIIDDIPQETSFQSNILAPKDSVSRRKCPSCGDESSIHEVVDKSVILMAYPRIYGKKKYCGSCGYEWK